MRYALVEAIHAAEVDEVPIGAVIFRENELLAKAHNQVEQLKDPTAHAEILAITQATQAVGDWRLNGCTLFVTKEPCPMCAGAIVLARFDRVVWAVDDQKRGGARSRFGILESEDLNHRPEIETGVLGEECRELLVGFFREKRKKPKSAGGELPGW